MKLLYALHAAGPTYHIPIMSLICPRHLTVSRTARFGNSTLEGKSSRHSSLQSRAAFLVAKLNHCERSRCSLWTRWDSGYHLLRVGEARTSLGRSREDTMIQESRNGFCTFVRLRPVFADKPRRYPPISPFPTLSATAKVSFLYF